MTINLTELTNTPIHPADQISRDNVFRSIATRFSTEYQIQVLTGRSGVGKTNTLAQFARYYADSTIAYYITDDPKTHRLHNYLHYMCAQLALLVGEKETRVDIDLDSLRSRFTALNLNLHRIAKRQNRKFYFVIDGLEKALAGTQGDRIVDILPNAFEASPYMLLSWNIEKLTEIPSFLCSAHQTELLPFALDDTRAYLADVGLGADDISEVHNRHGGNPRVLSIIKRAKALRPDLTVADMLAESTKIQKNQIDDALGRLGDQAKLALSYLAVSPAPLPVNVLANLTDLRPHVLAEQFTGSSLVSMDAENKYIGFLEGTQLTAKSSLVKPTNNLLDRLIKSIEETCPGEDHLLTLLIQEAKDYSSLQSLLTPPAIARDLQELKFGVSSIIRRLQLAAELAQERHDMSGLLKWTLAIYVVRAYARHAMDSDEIEALIALGESSNALQKVYAIKEMTNKVSLLAKTYSAMQDSGLWVSRESLDELATMVDSLRIDESDPEILRNLSIDLFPVVPDAALALLDKIRVAAEQRSILDNAVDALRKHEQRFALDSGQSTELRPSFSIFRSAFLKDKSFGELVLNVEKLGSASAREQYVRHWCLQNHSSADLANGIDFWIDIVIGDHSLAISLRSLRQICELVRFVPVALRQALIHRLRVPQFVSLKAPKEEWIRVALSLADGLVEIEPDLAERQIGEIYQEVIKDPQDVDTKIYCLARILVSSRLPFSNNKALEEQALVQFHKALDVLLSDSAAHLELLNSTINALLEYDADYAMYVSSVLNTQYRRHRALFAVIRGSLVKHGARDQTKLISDIHSQVPRSIWHPWLVVILDELSRRDCQVLAPNIDLLAQHVVEINAPILRAYALVDLASIQERSGTNDWQHSLDLSLLSWRSIDDLRGRIVTGFRLVKYTATINESFARDLFDEVTSLSRIPGSSLASGTLGSAYAEIIRLGMRSISQQDLRDSPAIAAHYEALIEQLPSASARTELYAKLASCLYRCNFKNEADELVRLKVLRFLSTPHLFSIHSAFVKELDSLQISDGLVQQFAMHNTTISTTAAIYLKQISAKWIIQDGGNAFLVQNDSGMLSVSDARVNCHVDLIDKVLPVIYEYDTAIADQVAVLLPEERLSSAWFGVIAWSLARCFLGDENLVNVQDCRFSVDFPRLRKCLEAASKISEDEVLDLAVTLIARTVVNSFPNRLDIGQALLVLTDIDQIAVRNLPDKRNFTHKGYLIQSLSTSHRARSEVWVKHGRRADYRGLTKREIEQTWHELRREAIAIPNVADRVLVMSHVARDMCSFYLREERRIVKEFLELAQQHLPTIPTTMDRIGRMISIAEAWAAVDELSATEYLYSQALESINALADRDIDEQLTMVVQSAYTILGEKFAAGLAAKLDAAPTELKRSASDVTLQLIAERMRKNPSAISQLRDVKFGNRQQLIAETANELLSDVATGMGRGIEQEKVVSAWLVESTRYDEFTVQEVVKWIVECAQRGTTRSYKANTYIELCELSRRLAQILPSAEQSGIPDDLHSSFAGLSSKYITFGVNETEKARSWLSEWLKSHARSYLKIVDPYFSIDQLQYCNYIPDDCKVLIVTVESRFPTGSTSDSLTRYWYENVSFRCFPFIRILLVPDSYENKFHDRVIVTENTGLDLGPSLNTLGKNRIKIRELTIEDVREINEKYVNSMLNSFTWLIEDNVDPLVLDMKPEIYPTELPTSRTR
jgi:hypothetical protein